MKRLIKEILNKNLTNIVIDEGDVLDNTEFKYRKNEDVIRINAIYNDEEIGYVNCEDMSNAYWFYEDELSDEEYDELFPEDRFFYISSLEITTHKYKGEGIAKELMKRAIAKAKQLGFKQISLNASPMGSRGLDISNLVGFYKSFGFKEILNQGTNILMKMDLDNISLNESNINTKGGVLLIKGKKEDDGSQSLYVTTVNKILNLDRGKVDNTSGKPATMAVLGNQVYRLTIVDDKLKTQSIAWNSPQSILNKLGISSLSVALNNNKTPLHWETLKNTNIITALNTNSNLIINLPNIKWFF